MLTPKERPRADRLAALEETCAVLILPKKTMALRGEEQKTRLPLFSIVAALARKNSGVLTWSPSRGETKGKRRRLGEDQITATS